LVGEAVDLVVVGLVRDGGRLHRVGAHALLVVVLGVHHRRRLADLVDPRRTAKRILLGEGFKGNEQQYGEPPCRPPVKGVVSRRRTGGLNFAKTKPPAPPDWIGGRFPPSQGGKNEPRHTFTTLQAHFVKSVCSEIGSVASSVTLLMSWLASNHGTNTTPFGGLLRPRV